MLDAKILFIYTYYLFFYTIYIHTKHIFVNYAIYINLSYVINKTTKYFDKKFSEYKGCLTQERTNDSCMLPSQTQPNYIQSALCLPRTTFTIFYYSYTAKIYFSRSTLKK